MKVLVIEVEPGCGALDLAVRAQMHGHKVKYFTSTSKSSPFLGKGLVDKVDDFRPWVRWADFIFNADNTKYLDILDRAKEEEACVFSCPKELASWELNRKKGMEVLNKHGVDVPAYKLFTKYDDAIKYVKKTDQKFVSKPCGEADKALSYVSKSPEDMVYMLERWKRKDGNIAKSPFILQDFKAGIEMAVGGFFGPGGFNLGWCENFEFKKLMNGDLGVNTGEQGTVLRFVRESKLANEVLVPLVGALERGNYIGYIDVNCIIDDKGIVWPLEFTMRPGWPTFNIQQSLISGDPIEWMKKLIEGEDAKAFLLNEIAIGVVLTIPDYPYSHATQREISGIPIYGITAALQRSVHMCGTMLANAPKKIHNEIMNVPQLCTALDYIMIVSATGKTVVDAREKVYRRVKRVQIPNSPMYRTDIGEKLKTVIPSLRRMGFAKLMKYR